MLGIARQGSGAALLLLPLVVAGCQALLVFAPEPDASAAPSDEAGAVEGGSRDAGPLDAAFDAALVCPSGGVCFDFEQGSDLTTYGIDASVGKAAIVDCAADAGGAGHCLRWTQPGFRGSRSVALGGSLFQWGTSVSCVWEADPNAYAYAAYLSFGFAWVVIVCDREGGKNVIKLATHDSSSVGVGVAAVTFGESPARVVLDIDLKKQLVTGAGFGEPLAMPTNTPGFVSESELGLGSVEGARHVVTLDDIVITSR